jgi:hypothetical protein
MTCYAVILVGLTTYLCLLTNNTFTSGFLQIGPEQILHRTATILNDSLSNNVPTVFKPESSLKITRLVCIEAVF